MAPAALALALALALASSAAAARVLPYPVGACVAKAPNEPCPNETCVPTECPALAYALAAPPRNTTYAIRDFRWPCDKQAGCGPCALWQITKNKCDASEACTPLPKDKAVLMLAKESNDVNGTEVTCETNNHWMILPQHPCTGVDSADRKCTGRGQGERFWQTAFRVATQDKGFPASGRYAGGKMWAVLVNPTVARSQHQMHLRMADLLPNLNGVVEPFSQITDFSLDAENPTLTVGDGAELLASIFVKANSWKRIGAKVRVFERGSYVARAARPNVPYGLLLTAHVQPTRPGRKAVDGFVVTAFFALRGTTLLDESVGSSCGFSQCSPWELQGVSSAAASAHRFGPDFNYD